MDFNIWLQQRLVAHGHRIGVDGVIGPATRQALIDFQRANGIPATGTATNMTLDALRKDPGGHGITSMPEETMPPWMAEMHRRMGLHEVRDNGALSAWLRRFGKFLGDPAKLPWCGDAIETAIVKTLPAEPVPNNPFWAQAWKDFGQDVEKPIIGAIGVIRWNASSGHVGIVADWDPAGRRVTLLGGNQSNAITLSRFQMGTKQRGFIAFRWPKTYPIRKYPPLTGKAAAGSHGGTR